MQRTYSRHNTIMVNKNSITGTLTDPAASQIRSLQKAGGCGKMMNWKDVELRMEFLTHSPEETELLGETLAKKLMGGEILAYRGDLGAGKTAFTRGLARGLGISDRVTSPTYTIVNEYEGGRLPLFHFDMYRLDSADELFDIGWEDYLLRGGVCAVEWSENVPEAMEDAITVEIRKISENDRQILIEGGDSLADLSL